MPDEGAVLLKEFIPQDLQGKEYLKPFLEKPWNKESAAEIFKKLDNAESLIGKRPSIPTKDAPEAEWDKFLSGLRPESSDEYEIKLPEGTKLDERGQAYTKALKDSMLEAGIPKQAAKKFIAKMQAFGQADQKDMASKMEAQQKKNAIDFDTSAKAALGDKREEIIARAKAAMEEFAPAVFKPRIANLSNEDLMTMAGTINAIMERYVPADQLNTKPGSGNSATDKDEESTLDAEGKALQVSAEYKDQFAAGHQKAKDRVKAIFTRIAEIRATKKR